jgi:succinyl-CoA synthetase alpha subunit
MDVLWVALAAAVPGLAAAVIAWINGQTGATAKSVAEVGATADKTHELVNSRYTALETENADLRARLARLAQNELPPPAGGG